MKHRRAFPTALVLAGTWLALAGGARAAWADTGPFSLFHRAQGNPLDPVRVSQAAPGKDATSVPAPATPAPTGAELSCKSDAQCPAGTYCDGGVCRPVQRRISVLLFQKEGPTTWFIPIYWSRVGTPGYRVIAPIYWHFWSAEGKSHVVAPFYWRFEDYLTQRVVTVIPPFAHSKQPDAESWAVWPLFYGSTKFGWAAPLLGSFRIDHPDQGSAWGSYLFLYWWSRGPGRGFDLGFPLFVSKRSTEGAFTYALPLNFYWRNGNDKNLLALPLFYWNHSPTSSTLVSLIGYWSTAEGGSLKGSAAWIYWFGRRSDSQYDVLFPLLWSFRTPTSHTFVFPPVLHIGREHSSFTTIFPLAFAAQNDTTGSAWKLFLPLYFSRTKNHGRSHTWLTPLGGGSRDDDAGTRSLTFLVPPIFWRKDSQHEFSSYLLLYWHERDVAGDASTTLVGPFYSHDDPTGSTRVGFPLFWYFRDAASGATAHSLFPLYFHRRSPDETSTAAGVFPFWGFYRRFTDGGWSGGLTPLAFLGSRGERSHAVIPPLLFFHFTDRQSSSTVWFPLYYRFADRYHSNLGLLPALYFQGHDHDDSYHVQFPLFWRFHDGEKDTTTTVIPPVYWRSRPDGWAAGVAPLIFMAGGPQSHFVLFPLFWHYRDDDQDRTTTVFLNYLHRRQGDEVTDALFPLLWWRRGARPGQQAETSFTLFPLVHYRRTPQSTVFASPVAAWGRGRERQGGFVGPYFWYQGNRIAAKGLLPVYFDVTHLRTGERTRMFGPWFQLDGPDHSAQVLFPLAAHYRDPGETGTYVFPTFFHRRTTTGYALDTLLPLFWFSSAPGYSTSLVGPYFHTRSPEGGSTGVVPLFVHAENAHRKLLATPLFYYRHNHDENTGHLIAPLVFHSSTADTHTTVVFPLWWSGHKKEKSHDVLFPLFWHFANSKEDTALTLAGPVLWSHAGSWQTRGLMPFVWYSRNGEGAGSNAFLPLFFERHTSTDRLFVTLPFGFKSAPDHKWFYVGPFIYRDGWDKSFWTLLPIVFHHEDKVSETHTTVIPPLLFYNRNSPGRSLTGLALLFWRQNNITSSMTLGLPLFYDIHSYHDKRLTMGLPLFIHYRNEITENTYTVTPISYFRSSPTDGTHVIFPLVWDFNSPERRTTYVFPFYAGFRRPTWQGHYVFPSIWYRTGLGPDTGTWRFMFVPFYEAAVKRPGDYMWEALMGFVGWERIGRNRYLKLFFYPFELAPVPAGQQAWRGPQPMARRERARGVSTGVW
jgi:hypothetical protein